MAGKTKARSRGDKVIPASRVTFKEAAMLTDALREEGSTLVPPAPVAPWPDPRFGYLKPETLGRDLDVLVQAADQARDWLLMVAAEINHEAATNVLYALGELHEIREGADGLRGRLDRRAEKAYLATKAGGS